MSKSDLGTDNPAFSDIENGKMDTENSKPLPQNEKDETMPGNKVSRTIGRVQSSVYEFLAKNKPHFMKFLKLVLLVAYLVYFSYAMWYRFGDEGSIRLLVVTILVLLGVIYSIVAPLFGDRINEMRKQMFNCSGDKERKKKISMVLWIVFGVLVVIGLIVFLVVEVAMKEPYNLVSFLGLIMYVLLCFVFSYSPAHVRWRPVLGGLLLQFLFALLILRTQFGFQMFKWLGDRVSEFLQHTDEGSKFLFGGLWNANFAFSVLTVIVFFSTVIAVLYYLGVMQVVILKVAYVMQVMMGTTAAESVNAAANIFIGQSEAPLVIRPLIKDMTRSELHAVMTGGFATIAGSVLAAYINFGVPANHLIGASVMSAPAALAMAKLFYPETQKSKTTAKNIGNLLEKSPEKNMFEAASNGASASIKLIANIAVNLVAFLAILKFVDATLGWLGDRVGLEQLTFGFICSYVFFPLAWMMGVQPVDCRKVGEMIGLKTFLNEFIAYEKLGEVVKNRPVFEQHILAGGNYTVDFLGNYLLTGTSTVLSGGVMQERSEIISTYALCGFANFGSMGIMLGALGVLAPHKKPDLSKIVLRAMIAGNVACFMTACIAGLMYEPSLK